MNCQNIIKIDEGVDFTVPHDPEKMQRVFKNLVKNAWEHHDGPVGFRISGSKRFVSVAVQNGGEPIPPDRLKNIFEKYNTTRKKGGGTGLGTTIALLFTRAHGGDIRVTSDWENGTEFVVRLPKSDHDFNAKAKAGAEICEPV
ncbi:MAG: HAMP domain-containing histidine kinase [Proteobacteria bacterium]|nr:HAMP domain-containing histidine kinase [Pseudomonadota bacterium]